MTSSFTEIAVAMAHMLARQQGGTLESFSLDGVETYTEQDGTAMIRIQATARVCPAHAEDEVPFEVAGSGAP